MEHQSMGILYENVHEVKASIDEAQLQYRMSIKEAEKEAMNTIQGQMLNKQRSINTLALVNAQVQMKHHIVDMSDLRGINRDT